MLLVVVLLLLLRLLLIPQYLDDYCLLPFRSLCPFLCSPSYVNTQRHTPHRRVVSCEARGVMGGPVARSWEALC